MMWEERYIKDAGKMGDFMDRMRTRKLTKEFQQMAEDDASDYHAERADHHSRMADYLGHTRAGYMHSLAYDAHVTAWALRGKKIDDDIKDRATEHAKDLTHMAEGMQEEEEGGDFV